MTRKIPVIDVAAERLERNRLIAELVDQKITSGNLTDYERFLQSIGQLRPYLIGRATRRG